MDVYFQATAPLSVNKACSHDYLFWMMKSSTWNKHSNRKDKTNLNKAAHWKKHGTLHVDKHNHNTIIDIRQDQHISGNMQHEDSTLSQPERVCTYPNQ
jgi:hypothetical protein